MVTEPIFSTVGVLKTFCRSGSKHLILRASDEVFTCLAVRLEAVGTFATPAIRAALSRRDGCGIAEFMVIYSGFKKEKNEKF